MKKAEIDVQVRLFGLDLLGLMFNFVKGLGFLGVSWRGKKAFGANVKYSVEK